MRAGALTAELVSRAGADAVSAVDPSASFAAAVRERLPGVDVRRSAAEQLPFPDDAFDAAMAQLVVHFMADPVAGLREMGRVTRPGGVVAACVWDHAGGRGPLTAFWSAVRELDPAADDESGRAGVREGHLGELFAQAGLGGTQVSTLTVRVRHASFDHWWEPFTLGVGPAGAYLASLDPIAAPRCASSAGACCPRGHSRSARPRGRRSAAPDLRRETRRELSGMTRSARTAAVIGGGIVGLAVARELTIRYPGMQVTVFDKEDHVAAHQSGHNSGVVHAGLYYAPGSLKAQLCVRGGSMLREFCQQHDIRLRELGKLVVASSEADAYRYEQLAKEGVAPQMQATQTRATADAAHESVRADEAAIESARASLQSDQSAVARAKLDLGYCEIHSPVTGRAGNLLVHPGNLVKVNDVALVVINGMAPIFVSFGVPEDQLDTVRQRARSSLPVEASPSAEPNHVARGVLKVIDNSVDANTGTIRLKAVFDNADRMLWPGQFVNVLLTLNTQRNATVVPSEAVQDGQHGQFIFVVKADQTVESRPVTVDRVIGHKAVIGKGVAAGETVVTDGQLLLFPGAKIQPVPAGKVDNLTL